MDRYYLLGVIAIIHTFFLSAHTASSHLQSPGYGTPKLQPFMEGYDSTPPISTEAGVGHGPAKPRRRRR